MTVLIGLKSCAPHRLLGKRSSRSSCARRCLLVAIDLAARWVCVRIYNDQTKLSSTDFLRRLHQTALMLISKILTDNGMVERFDGRISDVFQ